MTEPAELKPTDFAARYRLLTNATRQWLSYHFADGRITVFGEQLQRALAACDAKMPGTGERFVRGLAAIRYVPTRDDPDKWRKGYEQLVQKLAEILVTRVLLDAAWPAGTAFQIEPPNPVTGGRPELVVDTPSRQSLFEVRCPSFIDHQEQRAERRHQIPVCRPMGARSDATLPRDNTLKDFLASADTKFRDLSAQPRTGILVVLWDGYIFESNFGTQPRRHGPAHAQFLAA